MSCKMSSTNYGFIYAIQTREFLNTNTIKIGRTGDFIQRFKAYPKGSRIICVLYVNDYKIKEKIIINELKIKGTQRKDIGTEYFEGCITTIVNVITNICCVHPIEQKEEEEMFSPFEHYTRRPDYIKLFFDIYIEKDNAAFISLNEIFFKLQTWMYDNNIPSQISTKPELEHYMKKIFQYITITPDYPKVVHGLKIKDNMVGV